LREFFYFFGVQFLNYAVVTWNLRALVLGWYVSMCISDALISIIGFTIIKKISGNESRTAVGMAGYAIGGACGSLFSVFLTKRIFGQ
jgi:hypothetical protein